MTDRWASLALTPTSGGQVFSMLKAARDEFNHPWSIAELRLSDGDIEWLLSWFRSLGTELQFAEGKDEDIQNDFAGIRGLKLSYREEAELLIRNAGDQKCGFAICTKCGFSQSEDEYGQGKMKLPRSFDQQAPVHSLDPESFCWTRNETSPPVLRNRVIAAREFTDMLLLEWPGASVDGQNAVFSLGRALLLAGTRLLELDPRELSVELLPLKYPGLGIVIFDATPGGAGHCRELVALGREWIDKARDILFVDQEHDQRCERACLDCILDFSGQHKASMLDRRAALQLLDSIL